MASREIVVNVNPDHVRAFCEAVEKSDYLKGFNPHIAARYRISKQMTYGQGDVRLSASADGGPVNLSVNGQEINEGGAMSKRGFQSVIDVYKPGDGEQIASSMLNGVVLVLRRA